MIAHVRPGAVEAHAPAKLNLFLEVLGRRDDGYHELETLMVAVDLHDTLHAEALHSDTIDFSCDDPALPSGEDNLVVRAARLLKSERGVPGGARLTLHKRIPARAGLGGGSSDAATTLVALDRLWDTGCTRDELSALAARLGSDVPFFLHAPAAICRGRGERVEPLELHHELHFVLVAPAVGVSTPDVYRNLRLAGPTRPVEPCRAALETGDPTRLGRALFNRLQPVGESLVPDLTEVRDALSSHAPPLAGALMSGSGSAYFGLAPSRDVAERVARSLETLGLGRIRVVTCGPS
jgi:4-diphosphocytidyl-2-C-methyl-D-erythritol kinase